MCWRGVREVGRNERRERQRGNGTERQREREEDRERKREKATQTERSRLKLIGKITNLMSFTIIHSHSLVPSHS